jgi:hypothetical protein
MRRSSDVRRETFAALETLLPSVTGDWYGQLPVGTGEVLETLAVSLDIGLAPAALDALERAGSGSSAKAVARLAARAIGSRVSQRAADVLPVLVARQAQETAAATLLRPSSGHLTEGLLRPIYGGDPNVSHLLRASHADRPDARPGRD